jgi:hypothetical protein
VGAKLLLPLERKAGLQHKKVSVSSGVWFEFYDIDGRGTCEVDHLVLYEDRVIVVECKLTQTPRGLSQLNLLYLPVVRQVFKSAAVSGVMICKKLYEEPELLATSWEEVLASPLSVIPTLHWLGR